MKKSIATGCLLVLCFACLIILLGAESLFYTVTTTAKLIPFLAAAIAPVMLGLLSRSLSGFTLGGVISLASMLSFSALREFVPELKALNEILVMTTLLITFMAGCYTLAFDNPFAEEAGA